MNHKHATIYLILLAIIWAFLGFSHEIVVKKGEYVPIEVKSPSGPIWSQPEGVKIIAEITAYSEIDSCHYEGCPMANGVKAQVGYVACPRSMQHGTKVEIDGVKYECGDRTAKRFDGRFDIFMGYGQESYDKAIEFGIKEKEVLVYNN